MELNSETNHQAPPAPEKEPFKKVIEESKTAIVEVQAEKAFKRSRGRPRKERPKAEGEQAPAAETKGSMDVSEFIKGPLIFASSIPAVKYKIPELQLNADEAKACAESLNNLLNVFVPDVAKMDPKTAAVIGTCVTFGSVFAQKYMIYAEKTKAQDDIKADEQKDEAPPKSEGSISADSYFNRSQV